MEGSGGDHSTTFPGRAFCHGDPFLVYSVGRRRCEQATSWPWYVPHSPFHAHLPRLVCQQTPSSAQSGRPSDGIHRGLTVPHPWHAYCCCISAEVEVVLTTDARVPTLTDPLRPRFPGLSGCKINQKTRSDRRKSPWSYAPYLRPKNRLRERVREGLIGVDGVLVGGYTDSATQAVHE